ncbi:MAG: lipoxygenase family protein [Myxococcota bacterium]
MTLLEDRSHTRPELPQRVSADAQKDRAFRLSLARTNYNYMRSYLPPLAFSADLPKGENFSLPYEGMVVGPLLEIAENFEQVVLTKLEQEIRDDLYPPEGASALHDLRESFDAMKEQLHGLSAINVGKDLKAIVEFCEEVAKLPAELERISKHLSELPGDFERIVSTVKQIKHDYAQQGVTAFLKDTLFGVLRGSDNIGESYLRPGTIDAYRELYPALPAPMSMELPRASWMHEGSEPWQQDWYFGWLQIAGFNTTQLKGVTSDGRDDTLGLDALSAKMPISDALLSAVLGRSETLADTAASARLFAVDYAQFVGLETSELHGETRNTCAPIAVFYWGPAPSGYPPGDVLQPIAIQLGQAHDAEHTPIFTPHGAAAAREITGVSDDTGMKWMIAKWQVLHACAVQHETVAHLGDCHLVIEPMVVAMHRQLPEDHPVFALLKPHFRFTIAINHSALHSLVIPGGVVASVLSTTIEGSMGLVRNAYLNRRFDHRNPRHTFNRRGVAGLAQFPMRDDTLRLYNAIEQWARDYLRIYYQGDADVREDDELQGWAHEMASQDGAAVLGMDGLVQRDGRYHLESFDYLVQVVAQIIYTASAQHASVNYAQYPLMSFLPSVSGTAYGELPSRDDEATEADFVAMLPPIDVALYQLSFGYLLSAVQFDRLGYYSTNPRRPYFQDPRVAPALRAFQRRLAEAEAAIRDANETRPVRYETQIPSYVPNSISI